MEGKGVNFAHTVKSSLRLYHFLDLLLTIDSHNVMICFVFAILYIVTIINGFSFLWCFRALKVSFPEHAHVLPLFGMCLGRDGDPVAKIEHHRRQRF